MFILARQQTLSLLSGKSIQTPLLIPSFSSRGFEFVKRRGESGENWESEAEQIVELTAPHLSDSMLISAYDIHHNHLGDISRYLSIPEIVFVDSGGYERKHDADLSDLYEHPYKPKEWNVDLYSSVLQSLPKDPLNVIAIVSYDVETSGTPVENQIQAARAFLGRWPDFLHVLLLKPSTHHRRFLDVDKIKANVELLRGFHIIGVTEKELASSVLDRMKAIAKIRQALDDVGIQAPIHVFGALDPLLVPLYFLSGAEIFDGLSWLRYAYSNGLSIYFQDYGILDPGISRRTDQIRSQMLITNLNVLASMRMQMLTFIKTKNFSAFHGPYSGKFKEWYENLLGNLPGGR